MDIDIGAAVVTADGDVVGDVQSVIVDPVNWEVSDIVVHTNLVINDDFVVPVNLISKAEKGEVVLRSTLDQLRQMPHFVEAEFDVPPPGGVEQMAYNPGNILVPVRPPFPSSYPVPPPPPPLTELAGEVEAEAITLSEGTIVEAIDGPIGTIDDVLLDTYTDTITAFVIRENERLKKDIIVPIEWIAQADESVVKIAATREQAEHLLGAPDGWYLMNKGRRRRRK